MKRIPLILLLVSFWTASIAQSIEKTFYFDNPEIHSTGQYHMVSFENTLLTGLTGEPTLPYHALKMMLPPGFSAESIEVIGKDEQLLSGHFELYPKQAARPLSEGNSGEFSKNDVLYNSNINYPHAKQGNLSTEYMNGYAIALSTFTPVNYNPAEKTLSYYSEVTVRINIKQDEASLKAVENITSNTKILDEVKAFSQNPEMMEQYPVRRSTTDDYQMMIITRETFENDFQDLIDIYLPRGIIAEVVTVEYIENNISGQDLPEKIRNYIIQEYQDHAVEYILLGGDIEYVPYRGFYCYVQSGSGYQDNDIPADLYYSALDGTWNDDNDNLWGEIGEDDLLPDVSVARYTFSTTSELNKMIHKTTSYQDNPVTGELTHPLLAGEHLWSNPLSWGADYLDLLIGYQNENGYETTGIPENDNYDSLYDRDATWNATQLLAEINTGKSFIHHSGHSNSNYAMRLYTSDITNSNFYNVNGTDHNYTLVYTHGCICGAFDDNDCIAEHMAKIDNFMVAGAFNSRYGWFNEGQTEGPSAHIHREFVDALYDKEKSRIGETHKISKIETSPWVNAPGQHEEGALRWCFYDCNIFGDPALGIWCAEPIEIDVSYPATIQIGDASFEVTVTSNGDPVGGLTCTFINGSDLYGISTTDTNGIATITYDPTNVSIGVADLVVSGYNCLPHYYEINITPDAGPYVIYESHTLNDASGNGNGLADFNEDILLTIDMNNAGQVDASNVDVTIRHQDAYVNLLDSTENYGNIPAGQTVSVPDAFNFTVGDSVPDLHVVTFEVEASGEDTWISLFEVMLYAPILEVGSMTIDDQAGGNGNGFLDAGETVDIIIESMNTGHSNCYNTTGTLFSNSPYASIQEPVFDLGELEYGNTENAVFSVTIDESAPIGEIIDLLFTLESGSYQAVKDFTSSSGLILEDFETGNFDTFEWEFAGTAHWVISQEDPFEGDFCSKSGAIGDETTSEMFITIDVLADGDITFSRKVSSEVNYDFLVFYIDGVQQDEWSGEEDWAQVSYSVTAGEHTFKWSYEKDFMMTGGSDCAWVDYIIFPPFDNTTNITEHRTFTTNIFPNPANSIVEIRCSAFAGHNCTLEVFTLHGSKLYEVHVPKGQNKASLSVENWDKGMYFVRIMTGNQVAAIEKIVVN